MPKYQVKSSRAIAKRFKITSSGKYLRHKAGRSHLLQKKNSKRKQALRKVVAVKYVDRASLRCKLLR
jgi:large subunit ribosomal protein L35